MMKLRAVEPGLRISGTWVWSDAETGEERSSIGYTTSWEGPRNGRLRLRYTFDMDDKDYSIELASFPMRFDGYRWYFLCPASGNRALKLYLVNGLFVARTSIRPLPTYASQRTAPGWSRILARRWALRRKLGDPGDLFTPLQKPRWMRWKTFRRYANKDAQLEELDTLALLRRWGG
jgi:hypothetical protein